MAQTKQTHQRNTPMIRQYLKIRKQYKDCLLFYRMGDFYELFMEDAFIGAKVLNITLTGKSNGKNDRIPMAGVPYHAVDTYLAKLVKAGYKVAICEQLSPPNKKGLVKRDVVRIVTPGTVLDEHSLEKKENNYIISLLTDGETLALAVADLSTGYFATAELITENLEKTLQDELAKLHPAECILPDDLYNDPELLKILKTQKGMNIFPYAAWEQYESNPKAFLRKHFGLATLESFAIEDKIYALETAAALLGYLKETQKGNVSHIKKIATLSAHESLILDRSSMVNLELFATIREHDTTGTLLWVLDQTITAMGGRLLRLWMKKPLIDKKAIEDRLDAVTTFVMQRELRETLDEYLRQVSDIERLLSRLSVNLGNARDLVNLKLALQIVLQIKELLQKNMSFSRSPKAIDRISKKSKQDPIAPPKAGLQDDKETLPVLLQEQVNNISSDLNAIIDHIGTMIVDEPPIAIKDGGMIKTGVSKQLDILRETIAGSKQWIAQLEKTEREKTGIGSLKVRFNKVFGFYIEVSRANLQLVPKNYIRKQTLVNGERFITQELKVHEEIILTAEEKMNELEYHLFLQVLEFVLSSTQAMQAAAESIATLDCLANFAAVSEKNRYTRPLLLYSGEIRIKQGRHPAVAELLEDEQFVPNDVILDNIRQQLLLITGPNMAGKSVYIRQVALIVLLSQMGCFVPAEKAEISIVDRIFVRSGASDVITSGLSTFMVEMVETAYILNNATKNSLIILDEIGRGTSTYDGISIAWAVVEYLVSNINPAPKTLFATHYHELQALEEKFPKSIKNYHMAVTEQNSEPIFLHTVLPGGASHSFGVEVAKLAGVPNTVIEKAKNLLVDLEKRNLQSNTIPAILSQRSESKDLLHESSFVDKLIAKELAKIDIATLTPLEALNKLAQLKDKLKLLQSETKKYLEAD